MKKSFFTIIMFIPLMIFAETSNFVAPEFINSIYDSYSKNYIGTNIVAVGNTGASRLEGIENSLLNPAALFSKNIKMTFEFLSKKNKAELDNLRNQKYTSFSPIGFAGISFSPLKNWSSGVSVGISKSIKYEDFDWNLPTEDQIIKKPAFRETDFTLTNSLKFSNLSLGLNIILTNYYYEDYGEYWSYEYLEINKTFIRYQPGLYFSYKNISFGTSYLFKTTQNFDLKEEKYKTTIPSKFIMETTYSLDRFYVSGGIDYEKTSEQNNIFDDKIQYKFGMNIPFKYYNLKLGFFSSPSIFKGNIYYPGLDIQTNEQHIGSYSKNNSFFLTTGLELNLVYTKISYTIASDIANNSPAQMSLSLSTDITEINKKVYEFINE